MKSRTLAILTLSSAGLMVLALSPRILCAQTQESSAQSVAEAARRAREQKKPAGKPSKVITNDELKPAVPPEGAPAQPAATAPPEPVSPSAAPTAPQGTAPETPAAPAAKAPATSDKADKEKLAAELADLKKQLDAAQSDLDLLQRQFALQRDTYYSNPDYAHDTAGKVKLDQLTQQISDKQQAVEELKTKVAALQELVGSAPSAEKPATSPQS